MAKKTKKKAFITGITGQDGSYLADFLLKKGYEVHGLVRRASTFNRERIEHIYTDTQDKGDVFLHYGDLTDSGSIIQLLHNIKPDEVYNLGAQSHVRISFDIPEYTFNSIATGTLRLLDAIKQIGLKTKFYQASSSEMFGRVLEPKQSETTRFNPQSPYAIGKVAAHFSVVNYREAYNIFACNGILFNHESPRRAENFVTRKITLGIAQILAGKKEKLYLGNLEAKRDWGYAPEYVEAMWLILQQNKPDDFVIATGETHTIREFVEETARLAGLSLVWKGKGRSEKGIDKKTGKIIIAIDPKYYRPTEVDVLVGNPKKAKLELGWEPSVTFKELVKIMFEADCKLVGITLPHTKK